MKCLTIATIQKTHNTIKYKIKRSSVNLKIKYYKKVISKFKDEACGVPIVEFIGLKSKMYSYVKDNEKGGKTAKGIKKNVIKNNIKHEDYKNTLMNNEQMHHKIKSYKKPKTSTWDL